MTATFGTYLPHSCILALLLAMSGCSGGEPTPSQDEDSSSGAGGSDGESGGLTGSGGEAPANPGSGGDGATGGALGSGGSGSGGDLGSGGTSGGTGGDAGTGGIVGTGGAAGTGGAGTGGDTGSGGDSATGGADGGPGTPGCGNTSAAAGAEHLEMSVGGTDRTYWRWVPEGYDPNTPIPLIFAWHGSGGDGDEVRTRYFDLEPAVGDGAIILYPDGLSQDGGSSGWDLEAEGIDVQFFDAMLDSVSQDYCIDQERVFSTGYSFGGMFTYTLACSRGDKLRGIAPTAGAFFGGGTCPTAVPAWIAHAPNDDLVQYSWAESARDNWLSTNGCGTDTEPTAPSPCVAYDCPQDAPVHWCSHDEGHEWPSFGPEAIWGFFSGL